MTREGHIASLVPNVRQIMYLFLSIDLSSGRRVSTTCRHNCRRWHRFSATNIVTATMRHRKFLYTRHSWEWCSLCRAEMSRTQWLSTYQLKILPLRKNSRGRKGARAKIELLTWVVMMWPKRVGSGSVNHKQMSFSWCQDICHAYNRGEIVLQDPMRVPRGLYCPYDINHHNGSWNFSVLGGALDWEKVILWCWYFPLCWQKSQP